MSPSGPTEHRLNLLCEILRDDEIVLTKDERREIYAALASLVAVVDQQQGGGDPEGLDLRMEAEIHFLNCSIAVWREIDRLTEENGGTYPGLPSSTDLRVREREAWEHYRTFLDPPALSRPVPGDDPACSVPAGEQQT